MTLEEGSDLILAVTRALFVNGESTDDTLTAAIRLGNIIGLRARILPRWGELQVQVEDADLKLISVAAADPTGVNMDRVASTMRIVEELGAGRLTKAEAMQAVRAVAATPPESAWRFLFAAATGSVALALLFGVRHPPAATLIFVSAAIGAVVRRSLAHHNTNSFLQSFCAALFAGLIGGLAVRYQLSSSLRLVAVCPCMILVPGPSVLNGALDLIQDRIHLGAARLTYAGLIVIAISAGLLFGLALLGVSLPADPIARAVPLWQDTIAAGVVVACYGVFFSMPLRMLAWPVSVGMLAHAIRWGTVTVFGAGAPTGALIACLIVGLILTPVARLSGMPFAAIGFAAVVSLMPGVLLFRMAGGLLQLANGADMTSELLRATLADGITATRIIIAMGIGLVVPKIYRTKVVRNPAIV